MGVPDFRVGGRNFATLASQDEGFGNLKLTPKLQQLLIAESPDIFLPINGGWGRIGMTHIRLAGAKYLIALSDRLARTERRFPRRSTIYDFHPTVLA